MKVKQGQLEFGNNWGGRRKGAGRKPKGEKAGVSHRTRKALDPRQPVHITIRLVEGLPSLRRNAPHEVIREAIAKGGDRFGFRLVHYSAQRDHLHLICEAEDRLSLSKGMQALSVRISRGLNRLWGRTGRVIADRYHDQVLRVPRQVRNALRYVLQNCWKHEDAIQGPDPYSSAAWFEGWREWLPSSVCARVASVTVEARTWLLRVGWRRHGLISLYEIPGRASP